jgi:hypothetical protein
VTAAVDDLDRGVRNPAGDAVGEPPAEWGLWLPIRKITGMPRALRSWAFQSQASNARIAAGMDRHSTAPAGRTQTGRAAGTPGGYPAAGVDPDYLVDHQPDQQLAIAAGGAASLDHYCSDV